MKIEVQDLHVAIKGKDILNGINLIAEDGKMTGVIGPNGCGKSTLIKSVFGIVPMKRGGIWLNGQSTDGLSRKDVASLVGYVGQESNCAFDFTVYDVVSMALYLKKGSMKKSSREIVAQALEDLKIGHLSERNIQTLSGGERKMAFLARAIAQGVDTILLDEPTNHLDIKHQLFIMDYLENSGKTVVIVLHDLRLAAHYCDMLYLLKDGCCICSGNPGQVLTQAHVKQTFEVIGQSVVDHRGEMDFFLEMGNMHQMDCRVPPST